MLITHSHFDHVADAVDLGKRLSPQVVGIFETCAWLESKGVKDTAAMNKGGDRSGRGECGSLMRYSGRRQDCLWRRGCGYVVWLPGGPTIYHAGRHGRLRRYEIDRRTLFAWLTIGDHFTQG